MSSRTKRVRKRPSRSSLLAGSPALTSVDVYVDVDIDAKPARRSLPKTPHPANVASYKAYRKLVPPSQRIDDFPSAVKRWIAEMRDEKRKTGFVAWIGCEALADLIERRLQDFDRHPDEPLLASTVEELRQVLRSMRRDLRETKPF